MKQPKGAEKEKNPQGADQQSGVSKEYKNYDIGLKSLPPSETPSVEKIVESALKKEFSTGSEKTEGVDITTKAKDMASVRPEIGGLVTDGKTSLPKLSLSEKPCAEKKNRGVEE